MLGLPLKTSSIVCVGVALWLAACGGGAEPAEAPAASATAGGEAPRERPTGPPLSYVGDSDRVVVRIDMEAVRGSAIANDIASLVRGYPTWSALLGASGIDPVRDFDRVLVAAPAVIADRSVIVVRHHLGNARIREAVLAMAVDRGARPEWRDTEGFPTVEWPAQTAVPRLVVLTAENELVVTTEDDLARVVAVARDHAARREADGLVEPALQLEDGLIANIVADEVGDSADRMRYPPAAFRVTIREDGEERGRIVLSAQGTYVDDDSAAQARRYYTEQRNFYAGQMLVRAVGLDRPLREATIGGEGNVVDVNASLTEDEIQRVLGLVALGQIGGG